MAFKPQDHYFKKAKAEHYLARSVYKLKEIDEKYAIFRKGHSVLDLGASPGSWSQYVIERIGDKGELTGIDITPITWTAANAKFLTLSIYDPEIIPKLLAESVKIPCNTVISDMAPKTTGVKFADAALSARLCEAALELALKTLKYNGSFICKFFDGEDFTPFRNLLKSKFINVYTLRPNSTRAESRELFFICKEFRP